MSVILEFYSVDKASGIKTKIDDVFDIGALFKGSEKKIAIAIKNVGDETAISPVATIEQYYQEGRDYSEAVTWKKLSFDENADFKTMLHLPDIPAGSWMSGNEVYFEDFNGYSTMAGTKLDQNWDLWAGSSNVWEVYSGYMQHNVDTQLGRARWNVMPPVSDFELSCRITVRNGVYAGFILRDTGNADTGYIVLVQGQAQYYPIGLPQSDGVIQVFSGTFSLGPTAWNLIYQSNGIGTRGTHDFFKVRLTGNRFDFWYQNEMSDSPLYSFVDNNRLYTNPSVPVIAVHQGIGSTLIYYDDIRLLVPTQDGRIWVRDTINKDTELFGRQYSVFKLDFGGE